MNVFMDYHHHQLSDFFRFKEVVYLAHTDAVCADETKHLPGARNG